MAISTLAGLRAAMKDNGVQTLYVKRLAANDNSKQQIYLGPDSLALSIFPHGDLTSHEAVRTANFKASLDFAWLTPTGDTEPATGAQLIFYPDYPEVRLSGMLRGCGVAPSKLMNNREAGRLLFLGVTEGGKVLAYAASHDSAMVAELDSLGEMETRGVFSVVPPLQAAPISTRTALLTELGRIYRLGLITSQRLDKTGAIIPYVAANGGGYTLEAQLGIIPNGVSEPDYLGWEIKQYGVNSILKPASAKSAITLMTPEPTGGVYHDDFFAFMNTYGYPDSSKTDRLNFGRIHVVGKENDQSGLLLELRGYNTATNKITDVNGGLYLVDKDGVSAASWDFGGLLGHWSRKHSQAAYVPCERVEDGNGISYRYGQEIRLGEGTEALMFVRALATAAVYYDPAPKIENVTTKPKIKKRNQFRIRFPKLGELYQTFAPAPIL